MSDAEFERLWLDKTPAQEIARRAGITIETVSRRAKRMGLPSRYGQTTRLHPEAVAISNLLALDPAARKRVIEYVQKQARK